MVPVNVCTKFQKTITLYLQQPFEAWIVNDEGSYSILLLNILITSTLYFVVSPPGFLTGFILKNWLFLFFQYNVIW